MLLPVALANPPVYVRPRKPQRQYLFFRQSAAFRKHRYGAHPAGYDAVHQFCLTCVVVWVWLIESDQFPALDRMPDHDALPRRFRRKLINHHQVKFAAPDGRVVSASVHLDVHFLTVESFIQSPDVLRPFKGFRTGKQYRFLQVAPVAPVAPFTPMLVRKTTAGRALYRAEA